MLKRIGFYLLVLMAISTIVIADPEAKKGAIRGRFAYAKYQETQYTNSGCGEFEIVFRPAAKFEIGVGVGYYLTKSNGNWLSPGNFYQMPIDILFHVVPNPNGKVSPYFGGGASYIIFNYQMNAQEALSNLGFEASEEVENSFGYFAGGGVDISLSPKIGLNIDVKYRMINANATATIRDTFSGITASDSTTLKVNGFVLGGGITILF
ncbi:MAG: outer membrane beta-barrel protein [Acidobacteria bacterium]|nr:outer membrane beta-barrel protein [Acidobacteriota bacterium]